MITIYIICVVLCTAAFVYDNWNDGNDTGLGEFIAMIFVACIPVLNLVAILWIVFKLKLLVLKGKRK